tara:strand:- start:385 stop:1545 length:1161 start_codon:yes stop_codon:yes gene_type:complete
MSVTSAPIELAALTLVLALVGGLIPLFSKIKDNPETLRRITGISSGILLASALLVVVPEGFELATGGHDEHGHDEHGDDDALAGSIALVILELEHGDIDASEAIEEIEGLLGGHDEDEHDDHDEDDDSHDEEMDETLSENIEHVIEEVESGEINATAGIEEIEELITSHAHEEEVHGDEEEERLENLIIGAAILAGFIMMLILEGSGMGHAVHEEHHDHHDEHGHEHIHHSRAPWLLVLGLSLHSAADGLAIGSAAAGSSEAVTALVAMAVLIHKVPAAFSLGVFSMHEREDRNDSIKDVTLFALATPVMIMVSFYALEGLDEHLIALAMLFAAGTFLYVATVDTLPDIHNPETGREALKNVAIGVVLMIIVLYGADAGGMIEHGH